MHGIDIKTRAALIGMLRILLWSEETILYGVKAHIEK